jgi:hypothetical protein
MVVSSAGLGPKSDCSGKAQKQLYEYITDPFSRQRGRAERQETRSCQTVKEIWSWTPDGSPTPRLTGRLTLNRNLTSASNYAGNKHRSFKIMKIYIFEILNKAMPDIENIRGLNLAVLRRMADQMTKPPL